jgi:hypothetical protein
MGKRLSLLLVEDNHSLDAISMLLDLGFIGQRIGDVEVLASPNDRRSFASDVANRQIEWRGLDVVVCTTLGAAASYLEQRFRDTPRGPDALVCDIRLEGSAAGLPATIAEIMRGEIERLKSDGRGESIDDQAGLYLWALYGRELQRRGCHVVLYSSSPGVKAKYGPFFLESAQPRILYRADADGSGRVGWEFLETLDEPLAQIVREIVKSAPSRMPDVLAIRSKIRDARGVLADTSAEPRSERELRAREMTKQIALMPVAGAEAIDMFVPWVNRSLCAADAAAHLEKLAAAVDSMPLVQLHLDALYHEFVVLENIAHPGAIAQFVRELNAQAHEGSEIAARELSAYIDALDKGLGVVRRLETDLAYGSSPVRGTCTRLRTAFTELEDALTRVRGRISPERASPFTADDEVDKIASLTKTCKDEIDLLYKPDDVVRRWTRGAYGVEFTRPTDALLLRKGKFDGNSKPKLAIVPDLLRQLLANWEDNTHSDESRTVQLAVHNGGRFGEFVVGLVSPTNAMSEAQLQGFGSLTDMDMRDTWAKGYGSCRIADVHGGYIVVRSGLLMRDSRESQIRSWDTRTDGTIQEVHFPFMDEARGVGDRA